MPALDLHPQRDLKLSGEKGKLKDSLNIIIQKLSCFVISKMVRVKRIFHTLFVIQDLKEPYPKTFPLAYNQKAENC